MVNADIGGIRLLTTGWGDAGLSRLDRDVPSLDNIGHLAVPIGINDIGTGGRPLFGAADLRLIDQPNEKERSACQI